MLSVKNALSSLVIPPGFCYTLISGTERRKKPGRRGLKSLLPKDFMTEEAMLGEHKGKSLMTCVDDYTVIDLETTGLSPSVCEIIECAAVRVRGGRVTDSYTRLVRPYIAVPGFITGLTGISNAMLRDEADIEHVLPEFLDFIGDDIVVGHNVGFDIGFLCAAVRRMCGDEFSNDYIDNMRLSRRLFPQERHHRLSDLEQRFGLKNERAHRALSDTVLTQECYEILKREMLLREMRIKNG